MESERNGYGVAVPANRCLCAFPVNNDLSVKVETKVFPVPVPPYDDSDQNFKCGKGNLAE
jgi:hypothetical protein